jgi:hypothetical protein
MCEVRSELILLLRAERGYTSLLSWVSRTATPASTLPTVNEISIVEFSVVDFPCDGRDTLRNFQACERNSKAWTVESFDWRIGKGYQDCVRQAVP